MPNDPSLAIGQRSLAEPSIEYPLTPPLTAGCPETSDGDEQYPVEVVYDYDAVDPALFERPAEPGLERWAPLLPPLAEGTGMGEGATPLVEAPAIADWAGLDADVYVKDESQNPTWSQKDRLNRCVVSAAVHADANGVVASSTGNHGAAAAAYAARAGLPCVILTAPETPAAVQEFIATYGATLLAVPDDETRRRAVDRLASDHGYHAASTRTESHTGHAYGPEGYTTIAYETYLDLGESPGAVFVPTCYAELFYGVWKGFRELREIGLIEETPRMIACEPAVRGPHAAALSAGEEPVAVEAAPTEAYSIKAVESSHRGMTAIRESDGGAVTFTEGQLAEARERLARTGHWQEDSGAAGAAGLRVLTGEEGETVAVDGQPIEPETIEGPIVCVATSSGFKNGRTRTAAEIEPEWDAIRAAMAAEGLPL